jgi:hypothetical protein
MSVLTHSKLPWSGVAWGLTRKEGPWKETSEDLQKFNSRSNGPHAGHGNWNMTFNPHPYIQTERSILPKVVTPDVVENVNFAIPLGVKIPGINKSGSRGAAGRINRLFQLQNKYGVSTDYPQQGAQGNGLENVKIDKVNPDTHPDAVLNRVIDRVPMGETHTVDFAADINEVNEKPGSAFSNRSSISKARRASVGSVEKEIQQRYEGIGPSGLRIHTQHDYGFKKRKSPLSMTPSPSEDTEMRRQSTGSLNDKMDIDVDNLREIRPSKKGYGLQKSLSAEHLPVPKGGPTLATSRIQGGRINLSKKTPHLHVNKK